MRIREEVVLDSSTSVTAQELVIDAIRELEQQRERGEIEHAAYFMKKRSLVKML
ncbi:hypothetical protein [Leucobacter tenebrionis]|uniref:hypothetical protein n=1 Tax=Leucobacter tenebrionis TaxID=2873270 RepID=UPI001CA6415D|nr:hypothetical protein [Leucobacter tenebrionis]QZY51826.1 hypothetical protein KVY00_14930 [Leucobacter tenebrionis]